MKLKKRILVLVAYMAFVSCAKVSVSEDSGYLRYDADTIGIDAEALTCDQFLCPPGEHCEIRNNDLACFETRRPGGFCDMPCPTGQECRFDTCFLPDDAGRTCEFDDDCEMLEFCILTRCTEIPCIPGEIVECYSGPPSTASIGICKVGHHICTELAVWSRECYGEITPIEEVGLVSCNGLDDNCDGIQDAETLEAVDIVFAFDVSGSMTEEFYAVTVAISITAALYNDDDIRLGLVVFPNNSEPRIQETDQIPVTAIPLLTYSEFITEFFGVFRYVNGSGGQEANWDIPFRILNGIQDGISLRSDAKKVIIMFTDERGQSYEDPLNDESTMCAEVEDHNAMLFTFLNPDTQYRSIDPETGVSTRFFMSTQFDDCSTILALDTDPEVMASQITDIADTICQDWPYPPIAR